MTTQAVLLVNLGSPASPDVEDVRRYLREFTGDEHVSNLPAPLRWLLLRDSVVCHTRAEQSARAYNSIWTPEGEPLLKISQHVRAKLASALGPDVPVYLAMRCGAPSIADVVAQMNDEGVDEVLLLPQFPHYAVASWENTVDRVRHEIQTHAPHLHLSCIAPFYADADYIQALHTASAPYLTRPHDSLLFSYHGVPLRHLRRAGCTHGEKAFAPECCPAGSLSRAHCYRAQAYATARAFAARAGLHAERYSVAFQSRQADEPCCEPCTDAELVRLPHEGVQHLLVICPSFVVDCVETLAEIGITGREAFFAAGGKSFQVIPCLNDQAPYIDFLFQRVKRWLATSAAPAPHSVLTWST